MTKENIPSNKLNDDELEVLDSPKNRYKIEKINGYHRTFRPYNLRFDHGYIIINLNPLQEEEFEYNEDENDIAGICSHIKKYNLLNHKTFSLIKPQDDVCIDIFIGKEKPITPYLKT